MTRDRRAPLFASRGAAFLPALVALLALCATPFAAAEGAQAALRRGFASASIRAIAMEIRSVGVRLKAAKDGPGDPANVPALEWRIAELQNDLVEASLADPADLRLPEPTIVRVAPQSRYKLGDFLDLEGMTRSGPFLHVTGIEGDDLAALRPGETYTLALYRVMKRDYVLPMATSWYVYVDFPETGSGNATGATGRSISSSFRRPGLEILMDLSVTDKGVAVRVGSGGYTGKGSFRFEVEKQPGIESWAPHYVLTIVRVAADEGKAFLPDGVAFTIDLEKDLGLSGRFTFSVANRVYSGFGPGM